MSSLTDRLKQPEGKTLEYKRDLSSIKPILKTLVAFANTSGGMETTNMKNNLIKWQAIKDPSSSADSKGRTDSLGEIQEGNIVQIPQTIFEIISNYPEELLHTFDVLAIGLSNHFPTWKANRGHIRYSDYKGTSIFGLVPQKNAVRVSLCDNAIPLSNPDEKFSKPNSDGWRGVRVKSQSEALDLLTYLESNLSFE